ncbi:unnamed protein product, partial [Prorocentrum cordatum]
SPPAQGGAPRPREGPPPRPGGHCARAAGLRARAMGQVAGAQCGPAAPAADAEECEQQQPSNSAAADAADVGDKRDEPELLPVVASTDFTEVSRTVQIPQYRERAARASKGEYIEAKSVLRLGGLDAALRLYPHGDEDAPE